MSKAAIIKASTAPYHGLGIACLIECLSHPISLHVFLNLPYSKLIPLFILKLFLPLFRTLVQFLDEKLSGEGGE